jgi:hypothetical protein
MADLTKPTDCRDANEDADADVCVVGGVLDLEGRRVGGEMWRTTTTLARDAVLASRRRGWLTSVEAAQIKRALVSSL